MVYVTFVVLLLLTFFWDSQGAGFADCGTDDRCDLDGFEFDLPNPTCFSTKSADDCACRCRTNGDASQAWTFDKNYHRCCLGSRASQPKPKARAISGSKECECSTDASRCMKEGVKYVGNVIETGLFATAVGCSCACFRRSSCIVWSFNKNNVRNGKSECKLLSKGAIRSLASGHVSAVRNCKTLEEIVSEFHGSETYTTHRPTVTTTTTSVSHLSCAHGWSKFKDSCYSYITKYNSWQGAQSTCGKAHSGANLASIQSKAENSFVFKLAVDKDKRALGYWLGGYRTRGGSKPWTGMWKWIDNSPFNYDNWNKNWIYKAKNWIIKEQPDNYDNNELYINALAGTGTWNDIMSPKGSWMPSVCKYKLR